MVQDNRAGERMLEAACENFQRSATPVFSHGTTLKKHSAAPPQPTKKIRPRKTRKGTEDGKGSHHTLCFFPYPSVFSVAAFFVIPSLIGRVRQSIAITLEKIDISRVFPPGCIRTIRSRAGCLQPENRHRRTARERSRDWVRKAKAKSRHLPICLHSRHELWFQQNRYNTDSRQ